jgi:hypothetical protein
LIGQIFGLPDRERNDGERRIFGAAAGELTPIRNKAITSSEPKPAPKRSTVK